MDAAASVDAAAVAFVGGCAPAALASVGAAAAVAGVAAAAGVEAASASVAAVERSYRRRLGSAPARVAMYHHCAQHLKVGAMRGGRATQHVQL